MRQNLSITALDHIEICSFERISANGDIIKDYWVNQLLEI